MKLNDVDRSNNIHVFVQENVSKLMHLDERKQTFGGFLSAFSWAQISLWPLPLTVHLPIVL